MKFHLYSLFIFLSLSAFSQEPKPALVPFTDPTKSLKGLKSRDGKEVWKAEFTDLQQRANMIDGISYFFWTAKKNGLYGALDDAGKVILPFEFEQLEFSDRGYFIAKTAQEMLIYSFSGAKLYAGSGLDDIEPVGNGFIVTKNDQKGWFDLQFREQIPLRFTNIKPVVLLEKTDSSPVPEYSSHIFYVLQHNNYGIYDLKRSQLIPCKYENIIVHWLDRGCKESEAAYEAVLGEKRYIINTEGKVCDSVPISQDLEFYSTQQNRCSPVFNSFMLVKVRDSVYKVVREMRAINLQTGEKSGTYQAMSGNWNRFLCISGENRMVLDEHFNEIARWDEWEASWEEHRFISFDMRRFEHEQVRDYYAMTPQCNTDQVVIYSFLLKDGDQTPEIGIYDYMQKKQITPKYLHFYKGIFEGKTVYWMYKISKKGHAYSYRNTDPTYTRLDIYDEQFRLLKSFKGDVLPERYQYNLGLDLSTALFSWQIGEKYGAVNAVGKLVIPVKYQEFKPLHIRDYKGKLINSFYVMDGKKLFDHTGKEIVTERHTQFHELGSVFVAENEDKIFAIYNGSGKKLLDSVKTFSILKHPEYNKNAAYLKQPEYSDQNIVLAIRGEQLYCLVGEELGEVTAETFEFKSNYLQLTATILVDQTGHVLDVSQYALEKWPPATIPPVHHYENLHLKSGK